MACLRTLASLTLGVVAVFCSLPSLAKLTFVSSEIDSPGSDLVFCDLDGDGLQDAVSINETNLSIFFQDPRQGFIRKSQAQYQLTNGPSVVCPATLGRVAESQLLMTSGGVTEFSFTNRAEPPVLDQIIKQETIIPDVVNGSQTMSLPFSAKTGTDWPLLLVPTGDGLQVWQHTDAWRPAQLIGPAVEARAQPLPVAGNPGYARSFGLSLCVGDVNGDGRDDLMVMRKSAGGKAIHTLYLQNTNNLFNREPELTYTNMADWRATLTWMDLNRDGKLDLIRCTASDEPSFVPGLQSGKVLVAIYMADARGQIPAAPQQVFRKSDWSAFLPTVDVDGDGSLDLVLGYLPIDSRDGVRNMLTAGQINLNLKFHFFRPGAGFPQEPDFQRNVPVNFEHDLIWTLDHRIYFERFLTLDGDFNGDGKKDLLARDHDDEISVYFFHSRETGFSSKADLKFHCPEPVDWWLVKDLNGDGVSDLVIKLRNQDVFRIFISQGK